MGSEIMTKKDCDKLLSDCYYDEILHFDDARAYDALKKLIIDKILNKPIPFNDKDLFIDLFKYSVSQNSIAKLYLIYDHMDEIYKELDLDNEYSKNIYKCIFKIFTSSLIYDVNDIRRLLFLFKDRKYLSYLLTYLVNNFNSITQLNIEEYLTILFDIRDKFVNEEDFYKTSIYILSEIKNCKVINNNSILSKYLDSIYKRNLFNNNNLIDEYNNQSVLAHSLSSELENSNEEMAELSDRFTEASRLVLKEINSTNAYLNNKEEELLISKLENEAIDLGYNKLLGHTLEKTKIWNFIYGVSLLRLFLFENRINIITYCTEILESHFIKLVSDLELDIISYDNTNISDFINQETLNIIINGGVLYFNFSKIDEEYQQEIIDKINYIRNKIYYNNDYYEVNKMFKIVVLSCEECNINNFVKLDFDCEGKRRIR